MTDLILWLDLETDGLDTSRCAVLEVGCVLTKGFADGLDPVAEFTSPVRPGFGEHTLQRMPENVQEMHRASGLWDECLNPDANQDLFEVELRWLHWLRSLGLTEPGSVTVGGSGVDRFDIPIIERVFPTVAALFDWRRLDVSPMKLLLNEAGRSDLIPKQASGAHRALPDAYWARAVALAMARMARDAETHVCATCFGAGLVVTAPGGRVGKCEDCSRPPR